MRRLGVPAVLKRWFTCAGLAIALWPAALLGQTTTATILGTVSDETGAMLPGATVVITNLETGATRSVVTDEKGRYIAPQLALANQYEVRAELQGFRATIRRGIALTLGREAVVDLTLQLGEIAEDVVVTGEAALVETTHATVAGRIDERQMRELPLNSRSYIDLSLLQAGTIQARTAGTDQFANAGTHLTVAGARPTSTTFLMDGTTTTSTRGKAPTSVAGTALGVDAIREFEVITSPYSAEYGRGTGGTISVVTKSGTNSVHGSGFEFLRNSAFDARNFFDPLEGPPDFKRNQFGASLGGPIVRNLTFFFVNYEGLRQDLGTTMIYTVPTDATRRGVVRGQQIAIKPEVLPYLALYPQPNGRDFGDGTAEYSSTFSRTSDEDFATARIDQQFSSNQSFFARYTYTNARVGAPGNLLMFLETDRSQSQFVTLEHKSILSSRLLNTARFGFTRHDLSRSEQALVDIDPSLSVQAGSPMPQISPTSLSPIGSADILPWAYLDNTFEIYDTINYSRGAHTLKAGGQLQILQNNTENNTRQASRWNFSSLENFLLGRANRVQFAPRELADPLRNMRQKVASVFVQDDVRLASRLTVNLGLRAEYASTITETEGRLATMPLAEMAGGAIFDDIVAPADPWYTNPGVTIGPRVGVAWDPFGDGKTAVRGGYGIFYDHIWSWWMAATGLFRMGPYYNTFDLRETFPFPTRAEQFITLLQQRQGRQVPSGNGVYEPDPDPKKQRVNQYGIDLQRQLAGDMVVKIGYKGSRGFNLSRVVDMNTVRPESVVDGLPVFSRTPQVPNPLFGTMLVIRTDTETFYNALLAEFAKRFGGGWSMQAAYTWSKLIDEASGNATASDAIAGAGAGTALSHEFRTLDRGLSTYDVRHTLVTNLGLQVPVGAGRRFALSGLPNAMLGGWEVNGILTLASGNAAEISQGTTAATSILGGRRRPDLVPGGDASPVLGGPDAYFDVSQFAPASPQRYGTVGRNTLIGPGFANMDLSLVKTFQLKGTRLSVRGEMFNVLNRANLSLPNTQVFNGAGELQGSAGRITRTAASARQIQLGLRLDW